MEIKVPITSKKTFGYSLDFPLGNGSAATKLPSNDLANRAQYSGFHKYHVASLEK
jgi:hypothetical protein